MSKHHQHKTHCAFSLRALLHRERGPSAAVRPPHSRISQLPTSNEDYTGEVLSSRETAVRSQETLTSSESPSIRRGVKFQILGFSVQLQISRSKPEKSTTFLRDDPPPPYPGLRSESPMDSSNWTPELSDDGCMISELNAPNSYHELPASPHSYCAEMGDSPVSGNSLKRSSQALHQNMPTYSRPITTPDSTPPFIAAQYPYFTPGMTRGNFSPGSSSHLPVTPSPGITPDMRRQSSSNINISPLTQREMPLSAIYQDVEAPPAYNVNQHQSSGFESPPLSHAAESSFGDVPYNAFNSFDSNSAGSSYTPYSSFNSNSQYIRQGLDLVERNYPPPLYGQVGLYQYESNIPQQRYEHDYSKFNNECADQQYHDGNFGQIALQQRMEHVQRGNVVKKQALKFLSLACETCGIIFTGRYCKGNRERHVKTIHDQTRPTSDRTCSICHQSFKRSDAVRKHERRKHSFGGAKPTEK